MAHGNGRIYIDTSVTPNKGLTIADFQAIFGTNRNTLGDIIMYATARGLVNVWAKYKGVRSTKLGILALAERQDADFGIYIPACMTANGLSAFLSAYVSGYEYLWPRGEGNTPKEWFRRRDFNGYNHNANCFVNVYDLTLPSTYLVGAGDTGCGFHVGFNAGNNLHQDSVGISDLKLGGSSGTTFGDLYFGLLFVAGGTNKLVTSGSKLSVDVSTYGGGECRIVESNGDLEGITRNTVYAVYPVLSLLSHTSPASFTQQDRLVALPLSPFSFKTQTVVTQQNIAVLSCSASMNRGALQVDFGWEWLQRAVRRPA